MILNRMTRTGITVKDKENDNISLALRRFKKSVEASGKLKDSRSVEFYEKPTVSRKKAKNSAKARTRKQLEKDALPRKK